MNEHSENYNAMNEIAGAIENYTENFFRTGSAYNFETKKGVIFIEHLSEPGVTYRLTLERWG